MASLRFLLLLSSTLVLSLLFISVSADDFSTFFDKQTDTNDAIAIIVIQVTFIELMKWTGDPCYPSEWDWVSCSSNQVRPQITGLYLGGLGLVGYLPDISSMDALEIIDLHKNRLTGQIPAFLGTFPKLTELNLADNDFFGTVPSSISQNRNINLDITGNPKLCITETSCKNTGTRSTTTGTPPSPGTGSSTTRMPPSQTSPPIIQDSDFVSTTDNPSLGNRGMNAKKKNNVVGIVLGIVLPIVFVFLAIVGYIAIRDHQIKNAAAMNASETAAGENEMGAVAGKLEVPLQSMPTPSSNTLVPGILQGQAQEVPHHLQMQGDQQDMEIPTYNDEDYEEVPPYYPNTNDVETGNQTMKSETHH